MTLHLRALPLLSLSLLAACDGQSAEPLATPSPTAPVAVGVLSLRDALPSPTPDPALPSMPPPLMGAFVFYEDFEHGMARWRIDGGKQGVGWHLLQASTCGGRYTMVLGRANNASARLVPTTAQLTLKAPIRLPARPPLQLKYDLKGTVTPPEAASIQPEWREGLGPWRPLGPPATARFPLMVSHRVDLSPLAGRQLQLRFRAATRTTATPQKGFYLDDVHVLQGTLR
ncbi:MAG: hypothetical protein VKQ33_08210 [Candidatus Sericytochromatia bacterium]|nr:hypothetical protein [Candidatus Sericytochromatia bacterium]